jgi:hypothetical protein
VLNMMLLAASCCALARQAKAVHVSKVSWGITCHYVTHDIMHVCPRQVGPAFNAAPPYVLLGLLTWPHTVWAWPHST